jgi:hypothetical protein
MADRYSNGDEGDGVRKDSGSTTRVRRRHGARSPFCHHLPQAALALAMPVHASENMA